MAGLAPDNLRIPAPEPEPLPDGQDVMLQAEGPASVIVDPVMQEMTVEQPDGGVVIKFGPQPSDGNADAQVHDANLAEHIPPDVLSSIAEDLLLGISADEQSRAEWMDTRAQGIALLGLKLKTVQSTATEGLGISSVDHPMLLEAVLRFQANARSELLPASGPVKVRDDSVNITLPPPEPAPPPQIPPAPPPGADPAMMAGLGAPPPDAGMPPQGAMPQGAMQPPQPGAEAMGGNGGPPLKPNRDEMAEALEADLNHYLTTTAKEYYPDTDRMLFYVGFGGCGFKKVYRCPIRRRPVSESVDAKDLIVSNAATDLNNSGRVTHQIMMRPSTLKRMQLVGAYRDVPDITAVTPTPQPNVVDEKIAETQGVDARPQRPEDADHTIFECYCELDIAGFEHMDEGDGTEPPMPTGLAVPYVVVIDRDSREILAIRRNWEEGDDLCTATLPFVKYPFVPGLGFYDIGLIHILGNTTRAVTAAWREMLDAGMFANFPGFLFLKSGLRGNTTNEFRVAPGSGTPIDSSATDIRQAVMPLPYKDPGAGLMSLVSDIAETGARVGGTAEVAVGEGRQDAPVGTTIALIEQATKIVDAVHKRLHAAQAEEFQLLKAEFRKDPEALWRGYKKSKIGQKISLAKDDAEKEAARALVILALEDADIVPAADPNTPSHMHRIMKAVAIMQIAMSQPDLYDLKKVHERVLRMIKVEDADDLFKPPEPPPEPQPSADMVLGVHGELEKTKLLNQSREAIAEGNNATKIEIEDLKRQAETNRTIVDMAKDIIAQHNKVTGDKVKAEQGGQPRTI